MSQPILPANELLKLLSREEEKLADFKRRSNPLTGDVRWELVTKDGQPTVHTFLPSNPAPVLYRGQTAVHDPCISTAVRGLPRDWAAYTERNMLEFITRHARCAWFLEHLRHHPLARWAVRESVDINMLGVAQHYGLPTHYMDLTESPRVAAFFATCKMVRDRCGQKRFEGATGGEGILYRVRWHNLRFGSCRPIGLQPFPRPKEQYAWTYELWHGEDFQSPRCMQQPCVESIKFQHAPALSNHFLALFDGGNALFPPDVMAEVADTIEDAQYVPADMLRPVLQMMSKDADWALKVPPLERVLEGIQSDLRLDVREGVCLLFSDEQIQRLSAVAIEI